MLYSLLLELKEKQLLSNCAIEPEILDLILFFKKIRL